MVLSEDRGTAPHHVDLHVDIWPQCGHQRLWQSTAMAECRGDSIKDVMGFGECLGKGNLGLTLPETNTFAPKNGWLEDEMFLLGSGLFSGAFAVSFRECSCT